MSNEKGNSELLIQHSVLKKPEIRFEGFSKEWEAREFGNDLVSVQNGTNLLAASGNSGCPLIKMGNIQRGYFSFEKVERLSASVEVEKENLADYGDFLFNTRNTLELVGKGATWMGRSNEFAFNNNIARFTLKGIDTIFFNYLYNTQQMIKQVQARAMGTTSVAAIYPHNLKSIRYALPKVEEQTQIGSYFLKLDALINQHQQKHAKLSSIKKAMLGKMFPKPGETIPEIRFTGFSREWRTAELSNLALFNPKSELPNFFKYVDLESVKGTSLIGYKFVSRDDAPSRAQRHAQKGDVFYQTVRPYQKNNYLFNSEENDYVFSTGYAQLRPYFNGYFLLNLVQRDSFVKNVLDNCTGTSYPAINASTLATLEVSYPECEMEQNQIGNFFQKLDALINQHQQQITKLNNIKQACLSKMFV